MQTIAVGLEGAAPTVTIQPIEKKRPSEQSIYQEMWKHPEYRVVAPGESVVPLFLSHAKPKPGASVIDFGCGTGRGSLLMAIMGGLNVTMVDFTDNCLDEDMHDILKAQAHTIRFQQHDLMDKLPFVSEYGFCTDVMEHIPPENVEKVLANVMRASRHVFFQISTVDDVCGAIVGHPLHLTVKPYSWWLEQFNKFGAMIHWSQDFGSACMFYVTAWATGDDVVAVGKNNTEVTQIQKNVEFNSSQGWLPVMPHMVNEQEIMLLGGGPSLNQFEDDIRQKRKEGVKLVAMNNTLQWCLDKGIVPSALVMVDARPFNARFSHPTIPADMSEENKALFSTMRYLLCSQCDPSVFEGLPKDRTHIWHTGNQDITDILKKALPEGYYIVPGGSTVLLRAIPLFRMLGFKRFHLYGCDSCLDGKSHHAYTQAENDQEDVLPVSIGGRIFDCHPWMVSQAQEFMDLIKFLGDEIEIATYGDGVLNHILVTGAEQL